MSARNETALINCEPLINRGRGWTGAGGQVDGGGGGADEEGGFR